MEEPYQPSKDVFVLPCTLPVPGVGCLPVNAFVLRAEEPVVIDTGVAADTDVFIDAVASIVDLASIRWIWLTHDDSDHTGSLQRLMEVAPRATLVTNALGALRMSTWWPVPTDRVYAIRPGDELHVGDRTLKATKPPLFDNPTSTGFIDSSTGTLFSVDSFGAIIPEPTEDASQVPPEALAGGMTAWASFDSPWTQLVDRQRFNDVLEGVRQLAPTQILSSHLPAAPGTSLEQFLQIISSVPDADPFVAPDDAQYHQMMAALAAITAEGAPAPAG